MADPLNLSIDVKEYVARISEATPIGLVIISFELILAHINVAALSLERDDEKCLAYSVQKARSGVESLIVALDHSYEITKSLLALYIYTNKLLVEGYYSKKKRPFEEAARMMTDIMHGFKEAEKIVDEGSSVMNGAQRIFAGLTYGNGGLKEYIREDESRGYQA